MQTLNRRTAIALSVAAAIAAVASGGAVAATSDATATQSQPTQDTSRALVILNGDPLSTYVKTKPAKGKRIDFTTNTAKSYRAQLSALRNDYKKWLQANYPKAKITGNFDISLNAVAVELNGAPLAGIAATPLVKQAQYEGIYHKLNTVPDLTLVRAPAVTGGGGGPNAGAGVKVAIGMIGDNDAHQLRYTPQYAGNLVALQKVPGASGLDWGAALAAITSAPAEAVGMGDVMGSLKPGRVGDVVIWSGDPLELSSTPEAVFIDGVRQPLETRQTKLRDRYRTLEPGSLPKAYER